MDKKPWTLVLNLNLVLTQPSCKMLQDNLRGQKLITDIRVSTEIFKKSFKTAFL